MNTFRKNILAFDHTPGIEDVYKDTICACMVLFALFPLIWHATWLLSEKKTRQIRRGLS